ncbi:hypothetical protein Tco_1556539 [Tanacetum coccineum]
MKILSLIFNMDNVVKILKRSIMDIKSILTQKALDIFCETFHITDEVNAFSCPASFPWHTSKSVSKDPFPKPSEFNAEHYATLVAYPAPFHKYPEPFLCLVGISRHYTLDENTYPEFLRDNDEEMDLLAFIRTADPIKVRVGERQRAKDEPKLLDTTVGRVVLLLPVAPARALSELEASVDKIFDEEGSGNQAEQGDSASDGQDVGIQFVSEVTETAARDVAPLQSRRQKKRKTVVIDVGEPSHPVKKLREDHVTPGGPFMAGKSRSAIQRLLAGAMLNPEVGVAALPTLPFITSSVSATPEFVISSDSSHHSGVNVAEAEVDYVVRSSVPMMTVATTVTSTINPATTVKEKFVEPFLFGGGSSSVGGADHTIGCFSDLTRNDFIVSGIRIVISPDTDLQKVYVPQWSVTNKSLLDDGRVCREMVDELAPPRMRAKYNIKEKRRGKFVVDEQTELVKDEVKALKEHNATLEKENNDLGVKVADLAASVKVREQEVADLDALVTSVKFQKDNLLDQVHKLETSSAKLQEKVAAYENCTEQLEKFQDEQMKIVNERLDKLYVDFVEMALHLEEKFYPHLLTTISGRRWLLTHGMELAISKCLNSTEYLSALGAAISKAVKKGMQDGLSARITYGTEGRALTDVAAYNPSAEANYMSALQRLQSVNLSLIVELRSNKDASIETVMNLLRLEGTLAERLGLAESQPHVDQLMVPIHHSPDQHVIGASTLSLSLDVSSSRVWKIKENITNHRSALRDVFVPLSKPLSVTALTGTEGTSDVMPATADTTTALSVTFAFASSIPPISTDDYEVVRADGQEGACAGADPFPNVDDAELNIS